MTDAPLPPIPAGLPRVLEQARADPAFLESLVSGRGAFAEQAGITMSAAEKAALDSVPEAVLREMVANVHARPAPPVVQRPVHDFPAPGGCAADLPDKLKR